MNTSIAPAPPADHRRPLALVTSLFFMWGLLTALNDVLIPHLKAQYALSYLQAMLVQSAFFGAYFLVSMPAGVLVRRLGYQRGVMLGLGVAALGCALLVAAVGSAYELFLVALFVLAAGITLLQVAANPYVSALGPAHTASSRLTLTQAFNSLGTAIAPTLGLLVLPAAAAAGGLRASYIGLAAALLLLALFFARLRLPSVLDEAPAQAGEQASAWALMREHPHLGWGVAAIFLYVGAEVSIGSLLINFISEPQIAGLSHAQAAPLLSFYWGGAMLGRFAGVFLMRAIAPGLALALHALAALLLILVGVFASGALAMWALLAVGLCNSIMFPTVFSMAVHRLGRAAPQASGLLCMAIVGGALLPLLQGWAADGLGLQQSFLVPGACYASIAAYGLRFVALFTAPRSLPAPA